MADDLYKEENHVRSVFSNGCDIIGSNTLITECYNGILLNVSV